MGEKSKIEWTHSSFNAWWGCTKVSPGCTNCYAETFSKRYGTGWGPTSPRRFFGEKHWNEPFKWNKQAVKLDYRPRVFCASMSDVFEDMPELDVHRKKLMDTIVATPNLDWLLLTKRPENINQMVPRDWVDGKWPENIWVGTSVESQAMADKRIPELVKVQAKVRFLSCEPLIGPITFRPAAKDGLGTSPMMLDGIHWAIVGGESGNKARPMELDWARYIRDQCKEMRTAFFMKQLGGKFDKRGELEDLPEDLRIREFPMNGKSLGLTVK